MQCVTKEKRSQNLSFGVVYYCKQKTNIKLSLWEKGTEIPVLFGLKNIREFYGI